MLKIKKTVNFIFECEFRVVVVLLLFFLLGMVFGTFYSCNISSIEADTAKSIVSNDFISLCFKNLLLLTAVFLLGYTVIGAPLICFVLIYSGVSCGLFLGIFTSVYGFRGSVVAASCFYIFYLLNLMSLVFVAFSSLRLSFALYNVFKNNTRYVSPNIYSKPHMLKFCVFAGLTVLACLYYVYIARGLAVILI